MPPAPLSPGRFSDHVLQATPAGHVAYRVDLDTLPGGWVAAPGQTLRFQFWHRDLNPGLTHNTSDAVAVTFH